MPASRLNSRSLFVFVGKHEHENLARSGLTCPSPSVNYFSLLGVSAIGGLRA